MSNDLSPTSVESTKSERSPVRSCTRQLDRKERGEESGRPTRRRKASKLSKLQRLLNQCAVILTFFRSLPTTVPAFFLITVPNFILITIPNFFCSTIPAFFRSLRKPAEKVGPVPGFKASLLAIVFYSWINIFLCCIPVCWALHWTHPDNYASIFATGFIAIIPLAQLLALATDELSLRMADTLAGLVNATLGNVVELIVAIAALRNCELDIVQSSLIGSMLSNLLLVLGMCFFFGGLKFSEQAFEGFVTQVNSSLLGLSLPAVLVPAVYYWQVVQQDSKEKTQGQVLQFSRGIVIILLVVYFCYMGLSLFTHASIYNQETSESTRYAPKDGSRILRVEEPELIVLNALKADGTRIMEGQTAPLDDDEEGEEEEEEAPQLNGRVCFGLMVVVTALVAVTAEFLVGSINGLNESGRISKEFVGVILLPIVGNAAEHVSAVTVAVKDKMNLSIGVAVGSSIQIGLFVIPFSILVAWGMGKPMTLLFDPVEAVCLVLAVLMVNYCMADGKSNWLEGMVLMSLYAILGTVFFFYPRSQLVRLR
ncbi:calcium/proton exchanger, partial [Mycena olivaceomarginata]